MAVSRSTTVKTMMIFPMKYAAGGIGVPSRRLRMPFSRSMEIWIASVWNEAPNSPTASTPGTKYCEKVSPPRIG